MPAVCSAYNCKNRSNKTKNISYFKFPFKNKLLLEKWRIAMRRKNWFPTLTTRICSSHFEAKFVYKVNNRRRLYYSAVPSIFDFTNRDLRKGPLAKGVANERHFQVARAIGNTSRASPTSSVSHTRYNDLSERDTRRPSGALVDDTSGKPWEHDHGLYPKQLLPDPDEAGAAGRDARHSPDSQVTDTASEPDSDTDRARGRQSRERLRPTSRARSLGGARKRKKLKVADGESNLGRSQKRPRAHGRRSESFPRGSRPHSDYCFADKTVDEHNVLDIKEEPFCEELPTENICAEVKGEQNMCTTLLNTDCYRTVKIKQEKEEYPVAVKYEMVGTWC